MDDGIDGIDGLSRHYKLKNETFYNKTLLLHIIILMSI